MPDQSGRGLGILLIDHGLSSRKVLGSALGDLPGSGKVAATANAVTAMARLKQAQADLAVLDIRKGGPEDLENLSALVLSFPDTGFIACCGRETHSASLAVRVMEKGALDLIVKPDDLKDHSSIANFAAQVERFFASVRGRRTAFRVRRLTGLSSVLFGKKAGAQSAGPAKQKPGAVRKKPKTPMIEAVAIGVSTGGPNALQHVIPMLPRDLRAPVLIVQHIPGEFTGALAASLDERSQLDVREAVQGESLYPGKAYLAPGAKHLAVSPAQRARLGDPRARVNLSTAAPVQGCRPAVDVLLESMSRVYLGRVLAVIMTGMGSDGRRGVAALKKQGGYCITQSADSCVVYGMPRAVVEAGLSDEQVGLHDLAARITALTGKRGAGP